MIFFHLILHPIVPDFDIIIIFYLSFQLSEWLIKILLAHSELYSLSSLTAVFVLIIIL